jgi:hypothetical protein
VITLPNGKYRKSKRKIERINRNFGKRIDERGMASEDHIEECLKFLKSQGKVRSYLRTERNSQLDRHGVDFLFTLEDGFVPPNSRGICSLNAKSSYSLAERKDHHCQRTLIFVVDRFNTVPTEAERLFQAMIFHLRNLDESADPTPNPAAV